LHLASDVKRLPSKIPAVRARPVHRMPGSAHAIMHRQNCRVLALILQTSNDVHGLPRSIDDIIAVRSGLDPAQLLRARKQQLALPRVLRQFGRALELRARFVIAPQLGQQVAAHAR
jgi:hypothetical protein